jgi:DNA invertase Pin-like site-specific DNA recombinase
MTTALLVRPVHLSRLAVIYIRQSSPEQVERHVEGRERQYRLTERAAVLGWPEHRRLIIDDDQGLSGAYSFNRPGYQRLISLLALREVGIVLGLEVARLARNCLDWYQLLELAAAFDVLIADEDGLYDPGDFNDRLLLGLKGTFSEVERYQIRARLQRGRLHKAQRGALLLPLPIGFERRVGGEEIHLTADQAVRDALARIFALFVQLGSIRGVLRALHRAHLEVPRRVVVRGLGTTVRWDPPSYDAVYAVLTNPLYAGVYCFGKRQSQPDPLTHEQHTRTVARQDWAVVLPDHHEGYISLRQYEDNMARLEAHRPSFTLGPGAAREGRALLQGLVYCRRCGLRMRVRHQQHGAYYCCDRDHRRFAAPICCWASARRVDALVEELILGVLNAGTVELSLAQERLLQEEEAQREQLWQEKLQRLEYAADLARRRYEMVDPANRLVAQTLETTWNTALLAVEAAKADYQRQHAPYTLTSTVAQIQEMIAQFPTHWYGGTLEPQDKKEVLRCLIERVYLERLEKVIRAEVVWQGGARTTLDVPKYLFTAAAIYRRVLALAQTHSDAEIADLLNTQGCRTVKDRPWTARRVMDFRLCNAIPSGLTASPALRLTTSGYQTSAEVAAFLGVQQEAVQRWVADGVLDGRHGARQSQLWIHWTEEVEQRMAGRAPYDPRMVSTRRLCRERGCTPDEVFRWARAQGYAIVRLRRGTSYRFYILPIVPEPSAGPDAVV